MRNLGFALVVVSLVFGTGGVALVGRADPSNQSVAPAATSQGVLPSVAPAKPLPGQCAPKPATRHPKVRRDQAAQKASLPANAVPLNTRGYNYGSYEMPQQAPEAARPPAAPAKN